MATGCSKGITEFGLLGGAEKGYIYATENIKLRFKYTTGKNTQSTKQRDIATEVENALSLNDATKFEDASIRQDLSCILKIG